jgi:predicted flap endonuclease-1-like 5' DNA nuclease
MFQFLGIFDPGWRDLAVRQANTEITLLWLLAGIIGFLLYHFLMGRKARASKEAEIKLARLEKDFHEERARHHKVKQQLDAALSKANAYSSSASEQEKLKVRVHDLQKELEHSQADGQKLKNELAQEHARVTSMIVDHSEVEALRNRSRNQDKELGELRVQATQLKTALDQAQNERSRMAASMNEGQVAELRTKIQKLENDLHSSRLLVVKYQTEVNAVEEDKKRNLEASMALDDRAREGDVLKSKMEKLESDLQKLRQANAGMEELKVKLAAANSETGKWKDEADAQGRQAAAALELEQSLSAARGELQQLKEENRKLSGALEEAKSDDGRAAETAIALSAAQAALSEAQSKNVRLEAEWQSCTASGQALQAKVGELQAELSRLRDELSASSLPEVPDPLVKIEGIGPKIAELLHAGGIVSFRQLASASQEKLHAILDAAGEQFRIHDPGTWPEQARLLAEGKLEAFDDLTRKLKGGRRVD